RRGHGDARYRRRRRPAAQFPRSGSPVLGGTRRLHWRRAGCVLDGRWIDGGCGDPRNGRVRETSLDRRLIGDGKRPLTRAQGNGALGCCSTPKAPSPLLPRSPFPQRAPARASLVRVVDEPPAALAIPELPVAVLVPALARRDV